MFKVAVVVDVAVVVAVVGLCEIVVPCYVLCGSGTLTCYSGRWWGCVGRRFVASGERFVDIVFVQRV